jgi:hypothetical protein
MRFSIITRTWYLTGSIPVGSAHRQKNNIAVKQKIKRTVITKANLWLLIVFPRLCNGTLEVSIPFYIQGNGSFRIHQGDRRKTLLRNILGQIVYAFFETA